MANTNKNILITPGIGGILSSSISQIDFIWYESGIGTNIFAPNINDLRSTIYTWEQNSEPVLLIGGIGTLNNQRKFVGPYQDFVGSFTGISSFPNIQFFPLSGKIVGNTISVSGVSTLAGIYLSGPLYDINNRSGSFGQILSSTASGVAWTSISYTGIITAIGGITNRLAKFLDEDSLGNSSIIDNGTQVIFGVGVSVLGFSTSLGFFGPGTNLTNLNASNLFFGTVPSSVVSGSYSGITSVGNLSNLFVTGLSTSLAYFGFGSNLTNLNASNLFSGTVPSSVVSGSYSGITSVGNLSSLFVTGLTTSFSYFGFGSNLTNLNASNLFSGTVPSSVVSGSYSGITSVGNLSSLFVTGLTTSFSYFGFGSNLTNLNASNLFSGTVPSARISGSYSGITSVGNLSSLFVTGLTTSFSYFGFGSNLTNLNASNLLSGTVPSSVVSGSYSGITSVGNLSSLFVTGLTTSFSYFGFGSNLTNLNASNLFSGTVPSSVVSGSYSGITSVGNLSNLFVTGLTTSFSYFGFGSNLTNLNASNLFSGTVPSSVVSGSYSGITSVGNLSSLFVTGLTTSFSYFGFGSNLTNLNASNLFSGTVPSSVVSGSYSGITSVGNLSSLFVTGLTTLNNIEIDGWLRDSNNSIGLSGQILSSTSNGIAWTSISATGIITSIGGLTNRVSKFVDEDSLTNSNITDNGSVVDVNSVFSVSGISTFAKDIIVNFVNIGLGENQNISNTVFGNQALVNNTGIFNVAIGASVLNANTTGFSNVGLGFSALAFNLSGFANIGIGARALSGNVSGNNNIAIGQFSLRSNLTGGQNVAVGRLTLFQNISGNNNSAFGDLALRNWDVSSNQTGIGYQALQGNSTVTLNTGVFNVAIGNMAGMAVSSGSYNTFVGSQSGDQTTTGSNNTFLGGFTNGLISGDYQIAIGQSVVVSGSNQGAWGGTTNVTRTNLGIGTFNPLSRLHVETLAAGNMGLYIAGSASQTADLVEINATTNGQNYFTITGIGSVGIYTSLPSQQFQVNGNARVTGGIFDSNNFIGSANQLLSSTGSGIAWTSTAGAGIVTGAGVATRIAYFSGPNTLTSNSNFIIDSNGNFGISTSAPRNRLEVSSSARFSASVIFYGSTANEAFALTQLFDTTYFNTNNVLRFRQGGSTAGAIAFSFYDFLPNLFMTLDGSNAPRVGIGTTGPLQTLHVGGNTLISGLTTAFSYFGFGSNLTNLNASNLFSGTVPSSVVSGSYTGITSVGNLTNLNVIGISTVTNFRVLNGLYDSNNLVGLANSVLSSTGSGVLWVAPASGGPGGGTINGTIEANRIAFGAASNTITGISTFVYSNQGFIGINTSNPNANLDVQGTFLATGMSTFLNLNVLGRLYDRSVGSGNTGQILVSTNSGVAWTTIDAIFYQLADSQIAFGLGSDTIYGVSTFVYSGGNLGIGTSAPLQTLHVVGNALISGLTTSLAYFGFGSNLTNLNASNLFSGTVPSSVVSGSYAGITSVGNLSNLFVTGIATLVNAEIDGWLKDRSGSIGTLGQVLSSTGSGVAWSSVSSIGIITGSGTINTIAKFGASSSLINSNITDNGIAVTVNSRVFVNGIGSFLGDIFVNQMTVGLGSQQSTGNVAIGFQAFQTASPSASGNVAVGDRAMQTTSNAIFGNVAIGQLALAVNQANRNIAIGAQALSSNTSGTGNIAIGHQALSLSTVDLGNIAIGDRAMRFLTGGSGGNNIAIGGGANLTTAAETTFVGATAGNNYTTQGQHVAVGAYALVGVSTTAATGTQNTAIGYSVMTGITGGSANVGLGHFALNALTSGNSNTGLGYFALVSNTTGSFNVAVGREALRYYTTISNQTAVGYQALRGNSDTTLNTGTSNVAIGYQAGLANSSGFLNTYLGHQAGLANANGTHNTFIGATVGSASTSNHNTIIGAASYQANNLGEANIVVGSLSAQLNTSGSYNTVVGYNVFNSNTTGGNNAAFGFNALASNNTGGQNIAIGRFALRYYNQSNQVAIGDQALQGSSTVSLNTGTQNTAIGYQAGFANTSGSNNVFVGYQAGLANTSGTDNTFVGSTSGRVNDSGSNNTAVGSGSLPSNTSGTLNSAFGATALNSNSTGSQNSAFGYGALNATISGSNNSAFGFNALQNNILTSGNTGMGRDALRYYANSDNQTAVGFGALRGNGTVALNTGTQNTAMGYQAGIANTSGSNNVFVGYQAGLANTSGSNNTAVGNQSLANNSVGIQNVAVGSFALFYNLNGNYNIAIGQDTLRNYETQGLQIAIGYRALRGSDTRSSNTGFSNVAVGRETLSINTSGSNNTALGTLAGTVNNNGNQNTFVGAQSGDGNTSGSSNTYLGYLTDGAPSGNYQIAVGDSVTLTASNLGAWGGNTNSTRTDLGIGTFTPLARLHVETLAAGNMGLYIAGSVSQTGDLVEVNATANGQNYFTITGIGSVGIYTSLPAQALDVRGNQIVSGISTAFSFFGFGSNLTNLNASSLFSGTVPSSVVSGSYSGITSVGTLSQLSVSGFSTLKNFESSGQFNFYGTSNLDNQRVFTGASSSINQTTFVGMTSIAVPVGYQLTIEGKINGWFNESFNESGRFFAVFNNSIGIVSIIGQPDITSKFVGSSGNFDIQAQGPNVVIVTKSNASSNMWLWKTSYDYLLTQNV
jgi:hypothetical protein